MNNTTVVLATGNNHKVVELQNLLVKHGFEEIKLIPVTEIVADFSPDESGPDFESNAWIKANAAFEATGLPSLADDSGLVVDALNGEPGVYSARYSGVNATDASNREHLRSRLSSIKADQSTGSFRCALCLVTSTRIVFGVGECAGTVYPDEQGSNGFGYDAMFAPTGSNKRFAELTVDQKSAISHRSRAVANLVGNLRSPEGIPRDRAGITHTDLAEACVYSVLSRLDKLETLLSTCIRDFDSARSFYEALLQTYLFAGYPTALESLLVWSTVVKQQLPAYQHQHEQFDISLFMQRGTSLFETIYGGVAERMLPTLQAATPDLAEWLILEGYGKTLSRDGLGIVYRELCIVAVLAVQGSIRQLTSHVRGAFKVGASKAMLIEVAQIVLENTTVERYQVLTEIVDRYSMVTT